MRNLRPKWLLPAAPQVGGELTDLLIVLRSPAAVAAFCGTFAAGLGGGASIAAGVAHPSPLLSSPRAHIPHFAMSDKFLGTRERIFGLCRCACAKVTKERPVRHVCCRLGR